MSDGVDLRTTLTWHLLGGASSLSRRAFEIEAMPPRNVSDSDHMAHKGFVIGTIIKTASTLEIEAWEVLHYGPGNIIGSDGTD